jgi:mannose-6-phosphate isomerase-like protein (cupin superfamily)
MDVLYWEKWLKESYPSLKRIVRKGLKEVSVDELVAELKDGMAIAVIDRSRPHFHLRTGETYGIIRGRLGLVMAGKVAVLDGNPIHSADVPPGVVHQAMSLNREPAVVQVLSDPAWTKEDHFEV